ncbi:MAG: glycosyltransferase family 2 protein [Bacteroidia bacterium]
MFVTIIYIYRNRDMERVKRSLDSLTQQTEKNFNVIFVDYGSDEKYKNEISRLVSGYSFCRYVYNNTRGMPWNRSHALNTGIRMVEAGFVFTADIDMIFKTNFVKTLLSEKKDRAVSFFSVNYLPQNFSDWNNPEIKIYEKSKNFALGLALLPVTLLNELRGYDEFYCFWGQEDNDMKHRLDKAGVQTKFYDREALMHHQWHQPSTASEKELPAGWRVFQNDYFHSKKELVTRNENMEWGKLFLENERVSLQMMNDPLTTFSLHNGSSSFFIFDLMRQFKNLPASGTLVFEFNDVNSAAHLQSRLGKTISFLQRKTDVLNIPVNLVSKFRNLYTTVYEVRDETIIFILSNKDIIADYCLFMDEKKFKVVVFKK